MLIYYLFDAVMPFFIYAYVVCAFLGGGTAWASGAAADEVDGAAVSNIPKQGLSLANLPTQLTQGVMSALPTYNNGNNNNKKALGRTNQRAYFSFWHNQAQQAAKLFTRQENEAFNKLENMINTVSPELGDHIKGGLIKAIREQLESGAIITQPVPAFSQEVFENPAERVRRLLVNDGTYDRSILEHVKTRAPWIVKGSTVYDPMIRDMANEYDVFDQERLFTYLRPIEAGEQGARVKPFVIISIDLIRNDRTQQTQANKDIVGRMFGANPDATLVVDFGSDQVADGLNYNGQMHQKPLPDSVHHISFVGENVTELRDCFLQVARHLTSVDLRPLANVTSIEAGFLAYCSELKSIDLRNVSDPGRSAIRNALGNSIQNEWWNGTIVG